MGLGPGRQLAADWTPRSFIPRQRLPSIGLHFVIFGIVLHSMVALELQLLQQSPLVGVVAISTHPGLGQVAGAPASSGLCDLRLVLLELHKGGVEASLVHALSFLVHRWLVEIPKVAANVVGSRVSLSASSLHSLFILRFVLEARGYDQCGIYPHGTYIDAPSSEVRFGKQQELGRVGVCREV